MVKHAYENHQPRHAYTRTAEIKDSLKGLRSKIAKGLGFRAAKSTVSAPTVDVQAPSEVPNSAWSAEGHPDYQIVEPPRPVENAFVRGGVLRAPGHEQSAQLSLTEAHEHLLGRRAGTVTVVSPASARSGAPNPQGIIGGRRIGASPVGPPMTEKIVSGRFVNTAEGPAWTGDVRGNVIGTVPGEAEQWRGETWGDVLSQDKAEVADLPGGDALGVQPLSQQHQHPVSMVNGVIQHQ